jgi:hypothetical protein
MTRKDYVLLASHLRYARTGVSVSLLAGFDEAVEAIADALASENHRFDRDKFLEAVNPN